MTLCGMDECGRGAFAGPLVAGSAIVLMDREELISKTPIPIRDSKLLTRIQREKLVDYLTPLPIKVEIASIDVEQINKNGIGWANKEVFKVLAQKISADQYIVDGNLKLDIPHCESRIKADQSVLEVSIASIFAKVHRDKLMCELHKYFPLYGWDTNAGYGTLFHRKAIVEYGVCQHHRVKFVDTYTKKLSQS